MTDWQDWTKDVAGAAAVVLTVLTGIGAVSAKWRKLRTALKRPSKRTRNPKTQYTTQANPKTPEDSLAIEQAWLRLVLVLCGVGLIACGGLTLWGARESTEPLTVGTGAQLLSGVVITLVGFRILLGR